MSEEKKEKNESPMVVWSNFYDADGALVNVTIREGATVSDVLNLLRVRSEAFAKMSEHGWTKKIEKPSQVITTHSPSTPVAASSTPTHGEVPHFTATILSITESPKGKLAKLKGGIWSKWGVTCWPEQAAALGIGYEDKSAGEYAIDPIEVIYAADDEGKPKKVIGRYTVQASAPVAAATPTPAPAEGIVDDKIPF